MPESLLIFHLRDGQLSVNGHLYKGDTLLRRTPRKWRNDRHSERNLCNCVKKPEKKFRTSTGFEPVILRLPVRCSTN